MKAINVLLFALLLLFLSCSKESSKDTIDAPDAITKSSELRNKENAKKLPPESDSYAVFGYTKGIKGYVIKYSDSLYRGGDVLSKEGMQNLARYDIKTIISVTPNDSIKILAADQNIDFIDFEFAYSSLDSQQIATFTEIISHCEKPCYINCYSGNQRAGNLCAIYRIVEEEWDFEKAMLEYGMLGGKIKEDYQMLHKAYNIVSKGKY